MNSAQQKFCQCLLILTLLLAAGFNLFKLSSDSPFDTSLLSLLPAAQSGQLDQYVYQKQNQAINGKITLLISSKAEDSAQLTSQTKLLAQTLDKSGLFKWLNSGPEPGQDFFSDYSSSPHNFIAPILKAQIDRQEYDKIVETAIANIYNPFASFRLLPLDQDPLNFHSAWLSFLGDEINQGAKLQVDQAGYLLTADKGISRVIFLECHDQLFDLSYQTKIKSLLDKLGGDLATDGIDLEYHGLIFHAKHGADQAKLEMSTIGIGSLIGIFVLMLYLSGRFLVVFRVLVPSLVACIFALAICFLLFDRVHLITLAFGASIIGISIDYVMHYMCTPSQARQGLHTALYLGLISSLLAFLSFLFLPFPGLQQMGIFAISGLTAAWLTVVLFADLLLPNIAARAQSKFYQLFLNRIVIKPRTGLWFCGLVCLTAMPVFIAYHSYNDDVNFLNTSPKSMMQADRSAQIRLGGLPPSGLILVTATDAQTMLEREEDFVLSLDDLISAGLLSRYQALSKIIPSTKRQVENQGWWQTSLDKQGEFSRFHQTLGLVPNQSTEIQAPISFEQWQGWDIARAFGHRFGDVVAQQFTTIYLYGLTDAGRERLKNTLNRHRNITLLDRQAEISHLLKSYREGLSLSLMLAYGLLTVFLFWRMGRHAITVLAIPGIASLLALSILSLAGQALTVFHVLACILVLGIGLDMGIFLSLSRNSVHARVAVLASALTTFLAFGLLALCDTPVLKFFGQTTALGISLAWLVSALCLPQIKNQQQNDTEV